MSPALNPGDIQSIAAVVILAVVGIASHTESRTLLGGVVVALLTGSPAAVVGWALMSIMIYGVRFIWSTF